MLAPLALLPLASYHRWPPATAHLHRWPPATAHLHRSPPATPLRVPLVKYVATAKWRPVPVFVDLSVIEDSPQGGGGGGGGGGGTLQAVVQTSPHLKSALQNVSVSVAALPAAVSLAAGASLAPEGSSWDAESRALKWRVSKELVREVPVTCTAPLVGVADGAEGGGTDGEAMGVSELGSALSSVPFSVHFGCEGVTISGIELEVQLGTDAAASTDGSGGVGVAAIGKLMRRFTAGEYQVVPGPAGGGERTSDRDSRSSNERPFSPPVGRKEGAASPESPPTVAEEARQD